MSFFTFHQNNSYGTFVVDNYAGISVYVIVEAEDEKSAIERAESIGLYFHGAGDCECCGPRWSTWSIDATEKPQVYGEEVTELLGRPLGYKWIKDGPEGYVHYVDGRIVPFGQEIER